MSAVLSRTFLISLILLLKAPLCWGFSVSRVESYQQRAAELRLWEHPKWLKLGHYEKTLTGFKSAFRGQLFIHPEGYNSPQLELEASITALFSDSTELAEKYTKHPQCRFLARRKWLINQLQIDSSDILPCAQQQQWKQQLGATSVAVIFASADLGNPASSFGHTFLKLGNPQNANNKELLDYGVNYAADADPNDGIFYAIRGLFGAYRGVYSMLPYHQKIREYINLEGRDITEYHLNFTASEVDELVDHLNEMDFTSAPYYFFTDNCSYQILYALDVIRPEMRLSEKFSAWVIPADTIKILDRHGGLIKERKFKKSVHSEYNESYARLNLLQRKALGEAVSQLSLAADYELTSIEKAEVFETAMQHYAVISYREGQNTEQQKYQLALQRVDLGVSTVAPPEIKTEYPETSHDSSALYFGGGNLNNQPYSLLKFRSAYHDLEQSDVGVVPLSLIQTGVLELRYYDELKKLSLHRFTIMNLINTSPVTQLDRNLSWKARIDVFDSFRPDVEYAIGQSYDLNLLGRSRISFFLDGRFVKTESLLNRYQAGPEVLLITKPHDRLGISASLAYLAQYQDLPYLRFSARMNYQLGNNWDVQLYGDDRKDYQLSVLKNFIF